MATDPLPTFRWRTALLCTAAVLAAYAKSLSFPFVNWQDPARILDHAARPFSLAFAWRAFADLSATPYEPVAELAHALNGMLTGANPASFHAVNVALYVLATLLVYVFLQRWSVEPVPAAIGALVFALHPLRVEAVAWATGRAEILATLGVLLSALSFARYRLTGQLRWYGTALITAVMGIGSSVSAASWPLVLLLFDRTTPRHSNARWMGEMMPFMIIGLAAASIAVAGTLGNVIEHGLPESFWINVPAYPSSVLLFATWHTIVPAGLSPVYVFPSLGAWWWPILAVLGTSIWLLLRASSSERAYRYGTAWTLLFLLPAGAGLVDGPTPFNDRNTMLASVGLALIISAWSQHLLQVHRGRFGRVVKMGATVLLAYLGVLTSVQSEIWSGSVPLWTAAAERTPTSALVHNYLGMALAQESGELERAEESFTLSLRYDPKMASALANRGATRVALGRPDEGLYDLDEALRLNDHDAATRMLRASILRRLGRHEEALRDMHLALAQHPMNSTWMAQRVELLLEMGRTGEAALEAEVLRQAGYEISIEQRPSR